MKEKWFMQLIMHWSPVLFPYSFVAGAPARTWHIQANNVLSDLLPVALHKHLHAHAKTHRYTTHNIESTQDCEQRGNVVIVQEGARASRK